MRVLWRKESPLAKQTYALIAAALIVAGALTGCVTTSKSGSPGKLAAAKQLHDPGVQVLTGEQQQAVQEESAKIGFHIKLPQVIAGPETQLSFVTTNLGSGAGGPNRMPQATLVYVQPGHAAAGQLDIYEVNTKVAPPTAPAEPIPLPPGAAFKAWVKVFQVNGKYAGAVYTFETSMDQVAIVFPGVPGSTQPGTLAVVRMYESMK